MGKDFFGKSRFHCTFDGCSCVDFVSKAQVDMMEAEKSDGMDLLESAYHGMTCQAKSEYQLSCKCGHGADSHANRPREVTLTEGVPCILQVIQNVCFRKNSEVPTSSQIVKTKLTNGTRMFATGNTWRGPSGGLWAELDAAKEQKAGWVLIEGPGVGYDGSMLVDVPLQISGNGDHDVLTATRED